MKFEYVVTNLIVIGSYITLTIVVTVRMVSATQLDLAPKVAIMLILWGFVLFLIRTCILYYKRLD
jgi:hypothetical protein